MAVPIIDYILSAVKKLSSRKEGEMNFLRIRQLCDENKVSIAALEKSLGLPNGTIWNWQERVTNPRINNVKAVADYFNVTVDELIREPDEKSTDAPTETDENCNDGAV